MVGKVLLTPHQEGFGSKMRSLLQGHKERGEEGFCIVLTLTPVTLTHWRVVLVGGDGQQGNKYITTISNKF